MPKNREVLMDEEKRSNQNYEIIESCTIGSTELVIGHNPNSPNYCTEHGFRVDTEKHAFLLRCNPTKGDYNFYC